MAEIFTWSPAPGGQGDTTWAVREAKFGDGFTQRVADGINNESDSFQLTFRGRVETIREIRAFLRRHAGARSFNWTPPLGEPGLYVCKAMSRVFHTQQVYTITATFEQTFAP
ncbi:phage tail protein [Burkholderia gladioli]|uniref:phage tail protein n=1 Tax=Burkholderia gladioli TaxID=28095 RepID=UPI00163F6BDE|nr:phage tail protein [Burkholderia gladioli]